MVEYLSNLTVIRVGLAAVRQARRQEGIERKVVILRFLELAGTSPELFKALDIETAREVLVRGANELGKRGILVINDETRRHVSEVLADTAGGVLAQRK
jgi:hypothetical protein